MPNIANVKTMLPHGNSPNSGPIHHTQVLAHMNVHMYSLLGPSSHVNFLKGNQLLVWGPVSTWWGREHEQRVGSIFGPHVLHVDT